MKRYVYLLIAAFLLFAGCTVRQEVMLEADAGGTTSMEITLDSVLESYMRDLAASVGAAEGAPLFDTAAIRQSFSQRPGVTLQQVHVPSENVLQLSLAFDDIAKVVAAEEQAVQQLVDVTKRSGVTTVSFHLTHQTVRDALRLSPLYGSEASAYLLPGEGSEMSAEQYSEQLAWALEEYAEDRPIGEIIRQAAIRLTVRVRGEVLSQRGGTRISPSRVRFELPIVELLTVQDERRYEVSFR